MNELKIDWNCIDHDEFSFWYERYYVTPKVKAKDSKTLGKGFKKAKRNDFDGNF